jgi:hypothetical protein
MRRRAYRPPFSVGARVRYQGTSTAWFGGPGEVGVGSDREPDLYPGVVGEVIENHDGIDACPELLGPDDTPCDGWSVIRRPSGATRAAVRGDSSWRIVDADGPRGTDRGAER